MKVADVMARHVEFVEPGASVREAAALMGELDVSALPLGAPGDLIGIVTDRDILYRLVAEGLDPTATTVASIATRLVFTARDEDPIEAAMDLMAAHNIRRLPVVDANRTVIGWLTLSDLSRRLLVDSEIVQAGLQDLSQRFAGGEAGGMAEEPVGEAAALSPANGTAVPDSPPVPGKAEDAPTDSRGNAG